jgi:hypothetical protein
MNLRTVSSTSSWAALPDLPARNVQVDILNSTGEDLQIRYAGETSAGQLITIPDKGTVSLPVNSNANEIQIKATTGAAGVQLIVTP